MLIELAKSSLVEELLGANDSIVKLLRRAADAEEVDYEEALADWTHPGQPARAKVEAVLALPSGDRTSLADAVAADLGFEAGGEGFKFAFFDLDENARQAGKGLMGSMYSDVFGRGSFLLDSGAPANRSTWEDAFRVANPDLRVCPACLAGLLETRIEGRSAIDLDHYLPKSLYPPLAVHGPNLVPLCGRCNSRAKGPKDPLEDGDGRRSLASVWLPYASAGLDEAHLAFELVGGSDVVVQLEGIGPGRERAEHFDSLYLVSKLWSELLEGIHSSLCAEIVSRGIPLEAHQVARELKIKADAASYTRLSRAGAHLTECYCRWLLSEPDILETFVLALKSFPIPPRPP